MLEADNIRVSGKMLCVLLCCVVLSGKVSRTVRLCDEQQRNLTGFCWAGMTVELLTG